MNYLAHLFLAGDDPELKLGSLLADFTRGRLQELEKRYPPAVMQGIRLHREIDSYTDAHPVVRQSKERFSRRRRRYAGIIVDVLHDHFLSRHWGRFSVRDRRDFIDSSYQLLHQNRSLFPPRMQRVAALMIQQDWLGSYIEIKSIGEVYDRMSRRLRRPNDLVGSLEEVIANYEALDEDFRSFFPKLHAHTAENRVGLRGRFQGGQISRGQTP